MDDAGPTLTAQLLRSLDAIRVELTTMDRLLSGPAPVVNEGMRREVRRRTTLLAREADELLAWLAEARLEQPIH